MIERQQETITWLVLFMVAELVMILVLIGFVEAEHWYQLFTWVIGMVGFGTISINSFVMWLINKNQY